ncbi:PREDICTED: traB domain-containing protein [Myotis davidii]|uniref:traB domain-containing protein n=1 Tax=Myotis davidii TaxID=225400 RepID=UPI00076712AF|nr:PREDICTED: traB domain-containing protein [Myotis davidii]
MAESRTCCARPGTLVAGGVGPTQGPSRRPTRPHLLTEPPSPHRAPCTAWAPGEDGPVSSGSLVGAAPPAAMEEGEEQPAQETSTDPAGPSGAAEMVPRAPPGEPQNLCSCSQDHVVLGGEGGPLPDRPIPVTFKRAIAALSFWQKVKLAWGLCFLSDPIR